MPKILTRMWNEGEHIRHAIVRTYRLENPHPNTKAPIVLPSVGAPNDAGSASGAMILKEVVKGDGGQLDKLPKISGMRRERNRYDVADQDKALKYSKRTAGFRCVWKNIQPVHVGRGRCAP